MEELLKMTTHTPTLQWKTLQSHTLSTSPYIFFVFWFGVEKCKFIFQKIIIFFVKYFILCDVMTSIFTFVIFVARTRALLSEPYQSVFIIIDFNKTIMIELNNFNAFKTPCFIHLGNIYCIILRVGTSV